MTKIPSVKERVARLKTNSDVTFVLDRALQKYGEVAISDMWEAIEQALTALLTELRDSELLEEMEMPSSLQDPAGFCKAVGHNTLARAIKAHLNNLINPTK